MVNKIKQLFPVFTSTGITHELLKKNKNNNQHLIQKPDLPNQNLEMGRMNTYIFNMGSGKHVSKSTEYQ